MIDHCLCVKELNSKCLLKIALMMANSSNDKTSIEVFSLASPNCIISVLFSIKEWLSTPL